MRRPAAGAAAIRLIIVLLAVAALVLIPGAGPGLAGLVAIGTMLALLAPVQVGALAALAAEILGWVAADAGSPSMVRTVLFAIALYLLYSATTLAAAVPWAASVSAEVVMGWFIRCLPGIAGAVVVAGGLSALGQLGGSSALDAVGLVAALIAVAGIVGLTRRTLDR